MKLSPSFDLAEFMCHDGTDVPVNLIPNVTDLCIGVLQPLRNKWGAVVVLSGYRTPEYNLRIGGAKKSNHMTASAADIHPLRHDELDEFINLIETMHSHGELPALGGFGKYKTWVHLDITRATDGHLRRWHGYGVGSEPDAE